MGERGSQNPDNVVAYLETEQLEEIARQHKANFPKDWKQFSLFEQQRAVASLMRGGLTPYGFSTLEKGWLDQLKTIGERAQQMLEEISALEKLQKDSIDE